MSKPSIEIVDGAIVRTADITALVGQLKDDEMREFAGRVVRASSLVAAIMAGLTQLIFFGDRGFLVYLAVCALSGLVAGLITIGMVLWLYLPSTEDIARKLETEINSLMATNRKKTDACRCLSLARQGVDIEAYLAVGQAELDKLAASANVLRVELAKELAKE